ncbi:glycogen synthase [Sandaracinus amylolyticus]|uniref:glycogen synthase n=1 Tax=Sandaracinus amylolyticus TaxID=927083 RepID=UPI00069E0D9B|nr:glycogen/starch synthase [Sandaracinus amylolyticus]
MDILVVTAEIAPYSRATSAGETAAALPKALRGLGHKVTVLSPLWASIDPASKHLARRLVKIEVELEGQKRALPLFEGRSSGGVDLAFLAEETLFPRNASATDTGPETAARWGAFARATIELMKRRDALPEVVHCIGWQTAILPVLMREDPALAAIPTVLTVHDLGAHGRYDRAQLATFGVPEKWWRIDGVEFYGKLSPLKAGIQTASRITTPSPTSAREATESAGGLEGALSARGKALAGILEGVDVSVWNAATDPWLEARFDAMDVAGSPTEKGKSAYGKQRCKSAMQKELGLPVRGDVALVSAIGVATAGSGFDVLADVGTKLLRNDVQIVVVTEPGSDPAIVSRFVALAQRWSDRIAVRHDADQGMVHRALGASDLVIVPSPSAGPNAAAPTESMGGARAMHAHRYGALPIARRTGGVADAVVDCDPRLSSGSGFLWDEDSGDAMLAAIQRGIAAFTQPATFRALQHRVMTIDHSWDRSARLYERLYRSARGQGTREEPGSTASEART